jgi:putative sterol carrier protein
MSPKDIFETEIAGRLSDPEQQEAARELDAIYQFNVTGDEGGEWFIDLRACEVGNGTKDDAECTITIADADLVALKEGTVQAPQLFMMGKLQVAGNMGLAMKLGPVLGL